MWVYSSSVRPSLTAALEVAQLDAHRAHVRALQHAADHRLEELASVRAAGHAGLHGVLGVRHHAEHVEGLVADRRRCSRRRRWGSPRSRSCRRCGVGVAQDDLVVGVHARQRLGVDRVVALVVLDHDAQELALAAGAGERGAVVLDAQVHVAAHELEARVAQQGARQQARLDEDLEAVADAHHEAAVRGEVLHGLHDRAEARDGAAAQVVAVAEAARQDDGVDALEVGVLVPEVVGAGVGEGADGVVGVGVAVRAGEDDDTDAGALLASVSHRCVTPRRART